MGEIGEGGDEGVDFGDEDRLGFGTKIAVGQGLELVEVLDCGFQVRWAGW